MSRDRVAAAEVEEEYLFTCIRSIGCVGDGHDHACQRANDVARREHYAGLLDDAPGYLSPARSMRGVFTWNPTLGQAPLWIDTVLR